MYGPWVFDIESRDLILGFSPQYVWTGELVGMPNTFTLGMEWYQTEKNNIENTLEATRKTLDFYFTNSTEFIEDWFLDLGYRRGRAEFDFAAFDDVGFNLDAFNISLTWRYAEGSKIFVGYDRSFRVGALDEYIVYPDFPSSPFVNPGLVPQITKTWQAGIEHQFCEQLTGSLTVFHVTTDNEIFYDPADGSFSSFFPGANRNYDETKRVSIVAEADYQLTEDLSLFLNYTWVDARFGEDDTTDYDGNRVPMVPQHAINAGSEWEFIDGFTWNLTAHWVDNQYTISDWTNSMDELSSFLVVDTRLTYEWEWLTLYAGINNLLDEEYSEFATYGVNLYPSPERNFFTGVTVTFDF